MITRVAFADTRNQSFTQGLFQRDRAPSGKSVSMWHNDTNGRCDEFFEEEAAPMFQRPSHDQGYVDLFCRYSGRRFLGRLVE